MGWRDKFVKIWGLGLDVQCKMIRNQGKKFSTFNKIGGRGENGICGVRMLQGSFLHGFDCAK